MRAEALFINGVFRGVLEEILRIQEHSPDRIMYLQPYAGSAIAHLRDDPPSADDPMFLILSVTDDLARIHYTAEIVGWEDKTQLSAARRSSLNRVIAAAQPGEKELYNAARAGGQSVNLLHVRRTRRVGHPFSVTRLVKTNDGRPIAGPRVTSGGWAYVHYAKLAELLR
jgi:hypothetical protein